MLSWLDRGGRWTKILLKFQRWVKISIFLIRIDFFVAFGGHAGRGQYCIRGGPPWGREWFLHPKGGSFPPFPHTLRPHMLGGNHTLTGTQKCQVRHGRERELGSLLR